MPRKPTEKRTPEERPEKNRRSSSRSCESKSAAGKAIVVNDSFKHRFRAETVVTSVEDPEALRELAQEWEGAYRPRTPGQLAAMDRCIYYTHQFRRILTSEAACLAEQVNDADVAWQRDQQVKVAAHKAELVTSPEEALCGLNETAAGCRWLINEWGILKSVLDADGCWYAASHRDKAIRLLGFRPENTADENVFWLSLMNLCARDEPDARALAWYMEPANMPDTLRRILRNGPPVRDDCVGDLRARVDEELMVLKAREEYLRVHIEEPSRNGAPRRKLVLEGEEGARVLRYLRMNDTAFHRNLKQLEKGDQGCSEGEGEETTSDEEREAAARIIVEANRKADEYRAEAASKANVPGNEATNKANVPGNEATNKANVPGNEATNKANVPGNEATNKANVPDSLTPNRAKYSGVETTREDGLRSSSGKAPEVSPKASMQKSMTIPEKCKTVGLVVSPDDQGGSSLVDRMAPASGAALLHGGGGGAILPSLLNSSG